MRRTAGRKLWCKAGRTDILLTDYTRIKDAGFIAWLKGDTKREKEDEQLTIASGTVLSNDRVRSRLLGKHKVDAKELFPT